VILTRAVEKGSMVAAGTPGFSLTLTSPVWARAYVDETGLGRFNSGTKVTLTTDLHPDKPYHGVVGFVSPTSEFTPKSVETADLRTSLVYRLRIVVEDADVQLRQGMPVTVRLAQ
jgi:HlyD family secretion protein